MRFVGSVYDGANLIAKDVYGDYQVRAHGAALEWTGTILTPRGESIPPGGPYDLLLPKGRRGQILVTSVRVSNGGPTIINFRGTGPGSVPFAL
jgi:hypothetical protein